MQLPTGWVKGVREWAQQIKVSSWQAGYSWARAQPRYSNPLNWGAASLPTDWPSQHHLESLALREWPGHAHLCRLAHFSFRIVASVRSAQKQLPGGLALSFPFILVTWRRNLSRRTQSLPAAGGRPPLSGGASWASAQRPFCSCCLLYLVGSRSLCLGSAGTLSVEGAHSEELIQGWVEQGWRGGPGRVFLELCKYVVWRPCSPHPQSAD